MSALDVVTPKRARYVLGGIRLTIGLLSTLVPKRLVRSFGQDPEKNGAAVYALRLFGVRTIVLGVQLLTADDDDLDDALRYAVPIHASDATAALIAGLSHELPVRAAVTGTVTSSINTLLAVVARRALLPAKR